MFWSRSMRTVWRRVLVPSLTSCRMTGSASGGNSARRLAERRCGCILADRDRAAQDLGAVALLHADVGEARTISGSATIACTSSPAKATLR